jgi:hypothetical protein
MMSSLNASFTPSRGSAGSRGPTRLGPIRCCIRATTLRSASAVTALSRNSRLTTNGAASTALSAASGSGRSASSTPPISSAPSSPSRAAARMAVVSRPSAVGSSFTFHAAAACSRADASPIGRPPGSRPGSAPASRAPRSPARRGTHASRAPVAAASLLADENAPGEPASRSPARMTAPGSFSCASSARLSSAVASAPGTHSMSLPAIFVSPRVANGAIEDTCSAFLRAALRSRRYTIGDSSSGSKPTSRTAGALSRSA